MSYARAGKPPQAKVTLRGRVTGPKLTLHVVTWPTPTTVHELRCFLGLTNYFRKFIQGYASITRCLTNLFKKGAVWDWTAEWAAAFSRLKTALTTAPVLRIPDFNRPFEVVADASGHAVGAVLLQEAQQAVQLVVDRAPAYGLSLNPHKCCVWSPRPNPQHLDGFPLGFVNETRAGLIVLGAAVTVSVEYAASVAQAHVDAVAASLQRLPILRHPQAELLLLRSCLGTCKVVFTARTMPPAAAAQALVTFDMLQTQVLQSIVTAGGGGFGPLQQTLAGLPIAQGGLGVTKATSLLPCAYLASVTQTAPLQDRLLGTSTAPLVPAALAAKADYCALVPDFDAALFEDPDFVRSKVQARLSKPLSHRAYQEILDDPARSDRDRAVLQSLTQPGASDWLLALPVPHLQQTMPPESFRCRLQYQLLIPIFHPGSQCPCCLRELDVWGDHAVHCTSGGDVAIVGRHYSVRNGLDAVLTSARQRVTREPAFPTPVPGQERRRADLRLHAWEEGRDLYIDIVGSSPLTVANLLHFVPGGAAARAAQDKQTRYAVLLSRQQPPVAFQAFAFETLGGLHADALALLQRLQGLLNQAIIAQEDVEGYFVIRRVSFIIAAAVGRQLAARRLVQKLQSASAENPSLEKEGDSDNLVFEDGLKWLKGEDGTNRVFVPPVQDLRDDVIGAFHDREIAGHFGVKKTLKAVQRGFYWPRMDFDVHKYVTTCDACQRNKPLAGKPQGQHTPLPIGEKPWEHVSMDFLQPCVKGYGQREHL
eukprot:jgi/Botrbrau1/10149/Bobra.0121s0001.1